MPLCPALLSRPRGLAGYLEQALLPSRGGLHGPVAVWSPEYKSADGSYRDIIGGLAGVPSGVTYYNRVNVSGTLNPNIAADGWEVGGMYNGKPYYTRQGLVDGVQYYIWFRPTAWVISRGTGVEGFARWAVSSTTPITSYNPYEGATGTATVAADTSSGVYLFVPSVTETAGPTINQQTARAWGFGGTGWIDCGVKAVFDFTSAFTVSGWIKPTGTDSDYRGLIAKYVGSTGWDVGIQGGKLRPALRGTSSISLTPIGSDMRDGQWHYFACVMKPDSITTYVDGVSINMTTGTWTPVAASNDPLLIGARRANDATKFNGDLALASIHARALSADEIQYLYLAATKGV